MQGIFVDGGLRPTSKAQVKKLLLERPEAVYLEATSTFGEYDGPASNLPVGTTVYIVGPDPRTNRKFYGQIKRNANGRLVML